MQSIWEEFLVGDHGCEVEELMGKMLVFCGNAVLVKRKHRIGSILKELKVNIFKTSYARLKTSVFNSTENAPCSSLVECSRSILW